jgi:hypothetical protein
MTPALKKVAYSLIELIEAPRRVPQGGYAGEFFLSEFNLRIF